MKLLNILKNRKSLLLAALMGTGMLANAQLKVGDNPTSQQLRLGISSAANIKSAVLELQSTNQGLLFTRIADTALINTLNPPDGMVVYFTPAKRLLLRASGAWQSLAFTTYRYHQHFQLLFESKK